MARPSLYEKRIKPYLSEITELMGKGVTRAEIAKKYGISERTLYKYQKEINEFKIATDRGRRQAIIDLENSAFNAAIGGFVTVKKGMKCIEKVYDESGKIKSIKEVVKPYEETQYIPPQAAILCFLLKNWGNYSNEPQAMAARLQELELKKEVAKANNFDLDV